MTLSAVKTKKIASKAQSKVPTQLRLTVTPEIEKDLVKARKKYKYMSDIEIVKILIGKGSEVEFGNSALDDEPTNEEMLLHTSKMFQLGENWETEPDNIDYSKAKPINWSNFSF